MLVLDSCDQVCCIILQAELRRMQQLAVELRKDVQLKKQLSERKVKYVYNIPSVFTPCKNVRENVHQVGSISFKYNF